MGCDGFWQFIKKEFPESCKEIHWKDLKDKVVGIEGNGFAYKFNYNGNENSIYYQFYWLVLDLIKAQVKDIIIVFDGSETIELKSQTRSNRQFLQSQIKQKKEDLISELNSTQTFQSNQDSNNLVNSLESPLDIETVNKYAPRFFSNLKRKLDSETNQSTTNQTDTNQETDTNNEIPSSSIIESITEQKDTNVELNEPVFKMSKKSLEEEKKKQDQEWIEQEMKTWTKQKFLDTVLKKNEMINPVTKSQFEIVVEMLQRLGIKTFFCQGEAEAFCATLNSINIIDYVISDDSDLFPFGAKYILRDVSTRNYRHLPLRLFDTELLKQKANVSNWSDVCSLITNDYNRDGCKIDRLGINTSVKLISQCKNMENPRLSALELHYKTLENSILKKIKKPKEKKLKMTKYSKNTVETKKESQEESEISQTQIKSKDPKVEESENCLIPVLKGQYSFEEIKKRTEQINDYFKSYHGDMNTEAINDIKSWIQTQSKDPNYDEFIQFCLKNNFNLDQFQLKKEWKLFQSDWDNLKSSTFIESIFKLEHVL